MGSNGAADDPRADEADGDSSDDASARADAPACSGCSCKLGRSASAYGLRRLDERLRRRHADGASLRDLERFVNETILEAALQEASADVLGDVGSVYDTVVGDDASAGEQTEVRQRLAGAGVDVEAVESEFVSYQTVRTHLQECLDVDTDREAALSLEDGRGTIEWSRSRSEGIVGRTLERLAGSGAVAAGDLDVTHSVRVSCRDCGYSAPVEQFLQDGGCDCATGDATDVGGEEGDGDGDRTDADDDENW